MTQEEWLAAAPAEPTLMTFNRLLQKWGMQYETIISPIERVEEEEPQPEPVEGETTAVSAFGDWSKRQGAGTRR